MNANFKGVSVVLSDKAAGDIWDKIGEIDEKDAEQDAKDVEQDEAIAEKLDKDDGMGLIDEKLGTIDRAIEDLEDELEGEINSINGEINSINGEINNVNTALTGRINTNQTNIGTLQTALTNLTSKVNNIVNNAYSYREVTLWSGWFPDVEATWPHVGESITLSEAISHFDYIDVYISAGIGHNGYEEMRTFKTADIIGAGPNGLAINYISTIESSESDNYYERIYVNSIEFWVEERSDLPNAKTIFLYRIETVFAANDNNHEPVIGHQQTLYTHLKRIVGRKLTPLSQIIS